MFFLLIVDASCQAFKSDFNVAVKYIVPLCSALESIEPLCKYVNSTNITRELKYFRHKFSIETRLIYKQNKKNFFAYPIKFVLEKR